MLGIKIIDAHCHLHKKIWLKEQLITFFPEFLKKNYDENEVLRVMEKSNIEKSIILPFPCIEIDLFTANNYVTALGQKFKDRFIPFVIIDDIPEYWIEKGAKGFKEHSYGLRTQRDKKKKNGRYIYCQKFVSSYKFLEKHNLPLLFHGGPDKIERIKTDILKRVPNLIIILAHLGATFPSNPDKEEVVAVLKEFRNYPNIFFDISAICKKEILKLAFDIVGAEKLIFGSDFPFLCPSQVFEKLQELQLSILELSKVCYQNISNILFKNV